MGYKAAVQVLRQADDLKGKVSRKCDWLNDSKAWTDQQSLQTIYHQVLVLDLEYALDKKVEQDLWNIGFKNHITSLQELIRDKKNPQRADYQALLMWALESASGFYLTLLQELCNTFDINLPFRRRGSVFGQTNHNRGDLPQTSSCLYICQYCLVHLGDIARYRNQRKQAESFYKQAILVSPTSGHPYNQLALLEASQGNKLSTVFYYVRGIAVRNPFPASATNLLSTLSSSIDKESPPEKIQTKMTVSEFIRLFLCTHGYLHTATELKQAELAVKSLNSIMTALVATQSFPKDTLVEMTVINLFALKHVGLNPDKIKDLTEDEKKVRELTMELLAGSLCAFLVPVHTLKMDDTLLEYYALPAIKFIFYFIRNEPYVLSEKVFATRLQIWPSLVKFLNDVQKHLKMLNYDKYIKFPLPEDKNLQGFLPLLKNFNNFDFKEDIKESKIEKLVRIKRIVDISLWLTEVDVNGKKLIIKSESDGEITFEPGCVQPDPTMDLLEEMKSFNIDDHRVDQKKKTSEKKTGILKPQGSLEKAREEREMLDSSQNASVINPIANSIKIDAAKNKRGKNVALQSIFKKMEESKQVKFNVDDSEVDRAPKFEPIPLPAKPMLTPGQFPLLSRSQSFNQNHPAFPPPQPMPNDYLASLRNVPNMPMDKGTNYQLPKNEPIQSFPYPPPPNLPNQQVQFPNVPYQNHAFGTWKREEMAPPPNMAPSWWPNQPYRPEGFGINFQGYGSNLPGYQQQNMMKRDFGKAQANDPFNGSPWSNYAGGYANDGGSNFENSNQGMSMRQAMLKETNVPGGPLGPHSASIGRLSNPPPQQENKYGQNAHSTPGYSLFNANSWTPNLAGQLRNNKQNEINPNIPQQSLFSNQGPKSLAQLLEHQQSQLNNM